MQSLAEMDVSPNMMRSYLYKLFAVADENGDGVLSKSEMKKLLGASGFNFTKASWQTPLPPIRTTSHAYLV